MVAQEFEGFLFETFANPFNGLATNHELSNMEMAALTFEQHVFSFAGMKGEQICWEPIRGLLQLQIDFEHIVFFPDKRALKGHDRFPTFFLT